MRDDEQSPQSPADHLHAQLGEPVEVGGEPVFAPDGTALTQIRWMLSLSYEQRLAVLQSQVNSLNALREAMRHGTSKP